MEILRVPCFLASMPDLLEPGRLRAGLSRRCRARASLLRRLDSHGPAGNCAALDSRDRASE